LKPKMESSQFIDRINEIVFLEISDTPDLKFTVEIKTSKVKISVGWQSEIEPTIVLPLSSQYLYKFDKILEDGIINAEELQRIVHMFAIPALKAFYQSEFLFKFKKLKSLKLPKLLHIEITNPNKYRLNDVLIDTKVTVMSILGQFIILPGFIGVAQTKAQVTSEQALEFYELLHYKLPNATTTQQKKRFNEEYLSLREKTVFTNPEY
jgi:hypothetical protein